MAASSPARSAFRAAGFSRAALAAIAALCLAGCITDGKRAGVDEFPNSIYARVNGFLDEGKKSEEIGVPALGDSLAAGGGFIVAPAKLAAKKIAAAASPSASGSWAALAKSSAAAGCTAPIFTLTDSLGNLAPPKLFTKDTMQICMDAKFFDSTKGNETLVHGRSVTTFSNGRIESADVSDADGDGILNPVAGASSKATLVLTALEKGVLEKTVLTTGPGPDNNFDTEADNLIYAAAWTRTQGNDTLARASYADADSDGVAVDNGKASVVDLDLYQKGPSDDHPDAVWSRAMLRMVVRYHVDAKEVRRVRFETEDKAGRVSVGEVLGRDGGADFDQKDTVIAHFTTVGKADADSLDTLDVHLTMKLGPDFDSKADDSVYAIRAASTQKRGDEKKATFSFVSAKPIPSGGDPEDGSISMDVEYRDGTTLTVDGTLKAKVLDVIIVDRQGKKAHVIWDALGQGVSYTVLK